MLSCHGLGEKGYLNGQLLFSVTSARPYLVIIFLWSQASVWHVTSKLLQWAYTERELCATHCTKHLILNIIQQFCEVITSINPVLKMWNWGTAPLKAQSYTTSKGNKSRKSGSITFKCWVSEWVRGRKGRRWVRKGVWQQVSSYSQSRL